jgi:hypothetical protein
MLPNQHVYKVFLCSNRIFLYSLYYKSYLNPFLSKKPFSKYQRAGNVRLPRQNDFRTFCMNEEAEKVYQKLEEVMSVC